MQRTSHDWRARPANIPTVLRVLVKGFLRMPAAASLVFSGMVTLPLIACTDEGRTSGVAGGGSGGSAQGGTAQGGSAIGGLGGSPDAGGSAGTGASGVGDSGTGGASIQDGWDAGTMVDRAAIFAAICETYDELVACEPSPTCVDDFLGLYTFIEDTAPDCVDEADAYFGCMAPEPVTSYECSGDPVGPQVRSGAHGCIEEERAFNAGVFGDASVCAD